MILKGGLMSKKIALLIIITALFCSGALYAQDSTQKDKFSTLNFQLTTVWDTSLGVILEYILKGTAKYAYIPNKFFIDRTAVKIWDDDGYIAPQANVIFKNGEPFRIKIYIPRKPQGLQYRIIEILPDDTIKKFSVDKLVFEYNWTDFFL